MTQDCVLCRVASGEVRARIVVATRNVIGVMNDAEPQSRGHVVFFPRVHAERLDHVDDDALAEILRLLKQAAKVLALENYNVLQNNGALAGQTVFHVHFHLIPRWSEGEGLRYTWERDREIDQDDVYRRLKMSFDGR